MEKVYAVTMWELFLTSSLHRTWLSRSLLSLPDLSPRRTMWRLRSLRECSGQDLPFEKSLVVDADKLSVKGSVSTCFILSELTYYLLLGNEMWTWFLLETSWIAWYVFCKIDVLQILVLLSNYWAIIRLGFSYFMIHLAVVAMWSNEMRVILWMVLVLNLELYLLIFIFSSLLNFSSLFGFSSMIVLVARLHQWLNRQTTIVHHN